MRDLWKSVLLSISVILLLTSCQISYEETRGEIVLVGYESQKTLESISEIQGVSIVRNMEEIGVVVVTVKDEESLKRLGNLEGVDFIEKDVHYELPKVLRQRVSLEDYQWGLRKVMDTDGDGEPNFEIWKITDGFPVHVAIFDTPVDGTHPDLKGRIGIGYDPKEGTEIPSGTDYQDPSSDIDDHGTHVSGIIAALNDGTGTTGVAPGVIIHPVVMFKPFFFIGSSYYFEGIKWAVNKGARVFSNSWGGGAYSYTIKRAIDYALQHGVVVVFSAGNSYDDSARYPAMLPGVIAVGASNVRDETADFSSRGMHLSVIAPGKYIISTVPGGKYEIWSGTSMAAPHVSAIAAMVLSLHPDLRPSQVRKVIEMSAVDLYDLGFDENSGYGRVSASAILMDPPPPGANLVVRITDSSGEGVPALYLSLVDPEGRAYYVKTERNGIGRFLEIDRGRYELFIGGPDPMDSNSNIYRPQEEIHHTQNVDLEYDKEICITVRSEMEIRTDPPSTITVNFGGIDTSAFETWKLPEDHMSGIYSFFVPYESTVTVVLNGNEMIFKTSPESSGVCDEKGCLWRIF